MSKIKLVSNDKHYKMYMSYVNIGNSRLVEGGTQYVVTPKGKVAEWRKVNGKPVFIGER